MRKVEGRGHFILLNDLKFKRDDGFGLSSKVMQTLTFEAPTLNFIV